MPAVSPVMRCWPPVASRAVLAPALRFAETRRAGADCVRIARRGACLADAGVALPVAHATDACGATGDRDRTPHYGGAAA